MTLAQRRAPSGKPSLRHERALQRQGYEIVVGMDEVGRGALAGPVSVGVVAINGSTKTAPVGVRDSKLLRPAARERMFSPLQRWALGWGVGHAYPDEIDALGIMAGLRLAGHRALAELSLDPDVIILDGNHDWLTAPAQVGLFEFVEVVPPPRAPVQTLIKADMSCSSVAAASVLAKVTRDRMMIDLSATYPAYEWALNKGYAAPGHQAALRKHGPCEKHRRSWNITGAQEGREG